MGGRLAQLGARLIDVTAKQMSAAFFKRFAEEIAAQRNDELFKTGRWIRSV